MNQITLMELEARYSGRPAAVLGGGPSLPEDLKRLPQGCTLISVNHHALRLCQPDILVYLDWPENFPELEQAVRDFTGLRVSPHPSSDVLLPKGEWWDGGFSSTTAAWLGCRMGAEPVILCGMDCYQGEHKYFYERSGFYHPVFDYPVADHVRGWRPALKRCPNPQKIKAMGGPLTELFGAYEPESEAYREPI